MKKILFTLAIGALASCGDNLKGPTDAKTIDTSSTIDTPMGFPAAPTLGAQIDRMGRPAINTALNHVLDPTAGAGTAKDAYNADESVGTWPATYRIEFAKNLAAFDVLDRGESCTGGTCTVNAAADGCGNQVLYNGQPGGGGTPMATSYVGLGQTLADDQLYVDTTKTAADIPGSHANYLGVELNVVVGIPNPTCGGRAPTNDVIDTSYGALSVGINGFSTTNFQSAVIDGAGPHADVSNDTFPFLGAPH